MRQHLASTLLAVLGLTLPVRAQEAGGDPLLESAIRAIFRGQNEAQIRDGVQSCLRRGDAKAIAVLLKALDGPNPHVRDIAWEVLPDFKDPYARRRVAEELKTNKDNAGVRHWCAELLGMWGDADWLPFLVTALRDRDADVARAAARSLGMLKSKDSIKHLEGTSKSKDARLRADSLEALARLDSAAFAAAFRAGLADADGGVRCALLGAARDLYPQECAALSCAALRDADWRPRMQAVDNLALTRTHAAIAALITAVQDGRPAVRVRAVAALQDLTGQKFGKYIEWNGWWQGNAATFAFPEGKADTTARARNDETVASFHGVRIESDHCVFLIDRTPSMQQILGSAGVSKQQAAVKEFEAALSRLVDTGIAFNVGLYNEEFDLLTKTAAPLTKKALQNAVKLVRAAEPKGGKDIWNALCTVVSDPTVDTVVLLSSGEPEVGHYVHWNRVTRHLADLNRFHKVVVHTVVYSDVEWYLEQLRKLAEVTGGVCREVH